MTDPVTVDQLRNLTERAARGPLTADEQARLRDGINQLHAERDAARATNRRLNRRAQKLEAELAAYRRAVDQWEINERGTYVPLRTLAAIAKAAGLPVPERWELHYQRVEQAETVLALAEKRLARVQRLLDSGPIGTCCDHLLRAALDAPPANGTTRWLHVTITNPDEFTANRSALCITDFLRAEFPFVHVTTDAREWEQPDPG